MAYCHAALTVGMDIICIIIPITLVRQSTLHLREKVITGCLLSIGALGCVASLVRIKWLPSIAESDLSIFFNAELFGIWSAIEPGLGIIASSFATTRMLFRPFIQSISQRISQRSKKTSSSYNESSQEGQTMSDDKDISYKTSMPSYPASVDKQKPRLDTLASPVSWTQMPASQIWAQRQAWLRRQEVDRGELNGGVNDATMSHKRENMSWAGQIARAKRQREGLPLGIFTANSTIDDNESLFERPDHSTNMDM